MEAANGVLRSIKIFPLAVRPAHSTAMDVMSGLLRVTRKHPKVNCVTSLFYCVEIQTPPLPGEVWIDQR